VAEKAVKEALDSAEQFMRFTKENDEQCNDEILGDIKRLRKFFKARKYNEHQSKPILNAMKTLHCIVNEQQAHLQNFYSNLGKFRESFQGLQSHISKLKKA